MRDGIWKGLRLPREWKSVLKSCCREAERGSVTQSKLAHALAKSLGEVSSAFLRRLQFRAIEEGPMLPGLGDPASLGAVSVLEGMVAARFVQLESAGSRGSDLVQQALGDSTRLWLERMGRHIRQHCHQEAGRDAGIVIAALTAAEAAIDVPGIARARITGERLPRSAPKQPVSLEEDLLGAP